MRELGVPDPLDIAYTQMPTLSPQLSTSTSYSSTEMPPLGPKLSTASYASWSGTVDTISMASTGAHTDDSIDEDAQRFHNRYCLLGIACFQQILSTGIFWGWPALYEVLLLEGYHAERCGNLPTPCIAQKEGLYHVYVVANAFAAFGVLPMGFLIDNVGPRKSTALSTASIIAGTLFIAFSNSVVFDGLMLGVCLIAFFAGSTQPAILSVSNLFPDREGLITAILVGCYNLAPLTFTIIREIYYLTHDLTGILAIYAFVILLVFSVSISVWPNVPFPKQTRRTCSKTGEVMIRVNYYSKAINRSAPRRGFRDSAPLREQACTSAFLVAMLWAPINEFFYGYYIMTETDWIQFYGEQDNLQQGDITKYIHTQEVLLATGFLAVFFIGSLTDRWHYWTGVLITGCFSVVAGSIGFSTRLGVRVVRWLVSPVVRVFTWSISLQYLSSEFGFDNFGVLTGLLQACAGTLDLFLLFIYPPGVQDIVDDVFSVLQIALGILSTLIFGGYLFYHHK